MSSPRASGFTLLEVLVALVVLAVALAAIIAGGARYADAAERLRQKTVALWVAHNRLTEIELAPAWPDLGKSDDDVDMSGRTWTWHVEVKKTSDPQLRRADLFVTLKNSDASVVKLSAFISQTGRSNQ
ncbi:MAG: type II secretion system minor pseudopilin GspI [Gammaproteobacteria bacterium]|nr:type II secretion system minor pseudopilin GspI [Gammaproteobacteria bacterium]